jgi:hypothetical protein
MFALKRSFFMTVTHDLLVQTVPHFAWSVTLLLAFASTVITDFSLLEMHAKIFAPS